MKNYVAVYCSSDAKNSAFMIERRYTFPAVYHRRTRATVKVKIRGAITARIFPAISRENRALSPGAKTWPEKRFLIAQRRTCVRRKNFSTLTSPHNVCMPNFHAISLLDRARQSEVGVREKASSRACVTRACSNLGKVALSTKEDPSFAPTRRKFVFGSIQCSGRVRPWLDY